MQIPSPFLCHWLRPRSLAAHRPANRPGAWCAGRQSRSQLSCLRKELETLSPGFWTPRGWASVSRQRAHWSLEHCTTASHCPREHSLNCCPSTRPAGRAVSLLGLIWLPLACPATVLAPPPLSSLQGLAELPLSHLVPLAREPKWRAASSAAHTHLSRASNATGRQGLDRGSLLQQLSWVAHQNLCWGPWSKDSLRPGAHVPGQPAAIVQSLQAMLGRLLGCSSTPWPACFCASLSSALGTL